MYYNALKRYWAYKRGVIYFTLYSIGLFVFASINFWQTKTLLYFLIGFALSGIVAVLFMSMQYKIETRLKPNYWTLNILIDIVGYFIFTGILFWLFFNYH